MTRARPVKKVIAHTTTTSRTAASPFPAWLHALVDAASKLPEVLEVWYVPLEHGTPSVYFVGPKCVGAKFKRAIQAATDGVSTGGVPVAQMWGDSQPPNTDARRVWVRAYMQTDTTPQIPMVFRGAGGSDAGCEFRVVTADPFVIEVVALSDFWKDPVRSRGVKAGDRFDLMPSGGDKGGWTPTTSAKLPWWFFEPDGTMHSH